MTFTVVGSGCYLPEKSMSAAELDSKLGLKTGSCANRYHVTSRYYAGRHETALFMGARAADAALDAAGLRLKDVDLLICASGTNHQALPYNAAGMLREMQSTEQLASMDINSSCLSFLSALDVAQALIGTQRHKRILVVSSEVASVGIENTIPEIATMFADGSAAFILEAKHGAAGFHSSSFCTYPQGYDLCQIRSGGSHLHPSHTLDANFSEGAYFEMQGRELYKLVAELSPGFIDNGLLAAGLSKTDIDFVVPHQASGSGLMHLSKRLGFSAEQVVNIFAQMGNQGSGAGLTLGCGVLEL